MSRARNPHGFRCLPFTRPLDLPFDPQCADVVHRVGPAEPRSDSPICNRTACPERRRFATCHSAYTKYLSISGIEVSRFRLSLFGPHSRCRTLLRGCHGKIAPWRRSTVNLERSCMSPLLLCCFLGCGVVRLTAPGHLYG